MQIILSGAIPDPSFANDLLKHLDQQPLNVFTLLDAWSCTATAVPPAQARCTPLEAYRLHNADFTPSAGQQLSAGLAPLLLQAEENCNVNPAEALWLAELVHIAPSRDGAALLPAEQLDISEAESQRLFELSLPWFEGTPFRAEYFNQHYWRLHLPSDWTPTTVSSALVSQSMVNDWWEQDLSSRPWRRLVNEFQMLWFSETVNQQRQHAGLPTINSLWLQGGAALQQLKPVSEQAAYTLNRDLEAYALQQQWGDWLAVWQTLDPMLTDAIQRGTLQRLVFTGADRYLVFEPTAKPTFLQRLFRPSTSAWRKLWSTP